MDRLELAKTEASSVLNGLEDGTLTVGRAALKCLRVARLMNDSEAVLWLRHETSSYPKNMENALFEIAWSKGRAINKDSGRSVFTQTADELEALVVSYKEAIKGFSTAGVSVSGNYSLAAMNNLTSTVSRAINNYSNTIRESQANLSKLRGSYYDYALTVYNELQFASKVEDLFHYYRTEVDAILTSTVPESIRRLETTYISLSSKEPESWAQAALTCRRLIKGLADKLFKRPVDQTYKLKSGKELDVSGDKYKNRLFAIIDECGSLSSRVRLTISSVEYMVDYVEDLHDLINKGIHEDNPLTYEEARMAVIHTYVLLGDVLLSIKSRE